MVREPYRIARQEHLGDVLDALVSRGIVPGWQWNYDVPGKRALWRFEVPGTAAAKWRETGPAERLVLALCRAHGSTWEPVPHPGGQGLRDAILLHTPNDRCPLCQFVCELQPDGLRRCEAHHIEWRGKG